MVIACAEAAIERIEKRALFEPQIQSAQRELMKLAAKKRG